MQEIEDWEKVLRAAAELQEIVPGAVLVGGTAAAVHARHRISLDANHVLTDLPERFEALIAFLEGKPEWTTERLQPPVMVLGRFLGVETGIRQLRRSRPLETTEVAFQEKVVLVPTPEEMLRVKGWLALTRNALRDYIDTAALSGFLGKERSEEALRDFDDCYRDIYRGGEVSPLLQLARQLAEPIPYDLEDIDIKNYKGIVAPWDEWENIKKQCEKLSLWITEIIANQ
ncbi:MAG: hypothetical protein AB1512_20315 [Thermodesulfobacteriota bacterium]